MSPEEKLNRLLRFVEGEDERPGWMHRQSGWAQSGELYTYKNDSIVKLAVERFDRAAVFTVQIGISAGDGSFPVQAIAEVIWSINGTRVRRLVSVSQGVSISGVTESAGVAVYDATVEAGDNFPSNKYVALINVAPGVRAATTIPPFLSAWSSTQTIVASGAITLPIPSNAGVVGFRLSVSASLSKGAEVSMADSGGALYDQYIVNPGENGIFVPIASGATLVVVENLDTVNAINVSGQWAIDG